MTKEKLENFRALTCKLKCLKKDLDEFQKNPPTVRDVVTGSDRQFPYNKRTLVVAGVDNKRIRQLQMLYEHQLRVCIEEINEINEYIDEISDPLIQMIVKLYNINGLTWAEIGLELGYDRTAVYKKYKGFIEHSHFSHLK